jgi:hypothetical protein
MARMKSSFESGFTGNDGIVQKRCINKAGVQMYYAMSESQYIKQAFGGG